MKPIVVVGSCMYDLIGYVDKFPVPGQTVLSDKFASGFGGKGANQCVMARKLGAECVFIARVGNDLFGLNSLQNYRDLGINTEHVKITEGAATGTALIYVEQESGQNCIVIAGGANFHLTVEDVENAEAVIASAALVICQLEVNETTTLTALKLAKKHNVTTILNPAPATKQLTPELYKYVDIICPNETEALVLSGITINDHESAREAVKFFHDSGVPSVIITMGAQPTILSHSNALHSIECQSVTPVDTTGAGDSFIGSLAFFLTEFSHLEMKEMVRRASAIATRSILSSGTQSSFPTRSDLPNELFL